MSSVENINEKVARASKWSLATEVITRLISPIINIILARILVPDAFGAVASINMVITFAELFADAGFQKYIIQHEFESEERLKKSINVAFWSNFIMSLFVVIVIFVFRDYIAEAIGAPELGNGIFVGSLYILLTAFSSIQMAIFKRNLDFKPLFIIRVVTAFMPILITIPLALILENYWALVIGSLAMKLAQAVILIVKSDTKIERWYSFEVFKEMFSFSSLTLIESITIWLTANIDIFFVGRALNDYYLGLYKVSMTTVSAYMGIISSAIIPVAFVTLSKYQSEPSKFNDAFFSFEQKLALFVIPMGMGMYIFRELVTYILLGNQWMEASYFIGIWAISQSFMIVICYLASEIFRSQGKPLVSVVYQLVHISFLVPVVIWFGQFGFETLIIARTLLVSEFIISALLILHFIFKINILDIVKTLLIPVIGSCIMAICAYAMRMVCQSIIFDFFAILICIIVYFSFMLCIPRSRKILMEFDLCRKVVSAIKK